MSVESHTSITTSITTNGALAHATDDVVVTLDDIERLAVANRRPGFLNYYDGAAGQKQTLRENTAAFMRLRLRPRVLRGVAHRSTEVTLLGDQKLSLPVGISPTAAHGDVHTDGEVATAKDTVISDSTNQNPKSVVDVTSFSLVSWESETCNIAP
ncbi:hypothetical protein HPB47_004968 [Ixodes persulcatus]|uniref:Uncharacterized protein n=1 Tax=Ixodes persulcatus TaxID=34615 RepID=A0AC60PEA3_IXOPE|nr:hypothetical protein HPB47_004968 [Ixodes persulcatus]